MSEIHWAITIGIAALYAAPWIAAAVFWNEARMWRNLATDGVRLLVESNRDWRLILDKAVERLPSRKEASDE